MSLSFANNFWGKEDAGVSPLLERMHNAKVTSDEVKAFYGSRAAIEDEYARKLFSLCRKPLGSSESGSLRSSLDTVRGELESMAKAHQNIAHQMKSELEEPLAAHGGGMKERRKIVQNGIEKLLKVKVQQAQAVNKTRDRYEQDCLRIKGYLAQGHMVMGQEERKNKAKLEKTQIHLATSNYDYENAIKALEETTVRWNREWKAACDKFQDLEEERLDFMKNSLWSFANIASTVCVSDDASCEKIRLSLENCEVEKDIAGFIRDRGTGQEIPDAPKYINFCRGDVNDSQSDTSDDEAYSVAQFPRTINPAFRTSSPQSSAFESHHDPQPAFGREGPQHDPYTPPSRERTMTPQKALPAKAQQLPAGYQNAPTGQVTIQQDQLPKVPHNEYPMDGMTMYCRTAPPSDRSSAASPARPMSRDSQSDCSNPTSFSSYEVVSGKQSPTKQVPVAVAPATPLDNQLQKKKSGFFQNHSPFRRKSKHEKENRAIEHAAVTAPSASRGAGFSTSVTRTGQAGRDGPMRPSTIRGGERQSMLLGNDRQSHSPEPADPRANFQLNVGNNVFDVASPDEWSSATARAQKGQPQQELDPIAQALAELKGVGKPSSKRMSADHYHGLQTPAPSSAQATPTALSKAAPPSPMPRRATPPPSYDQPAKKLDLPAPAFTSAQMQKTRQKYLDQRQSMFGEPTPSAASTRQAPVQARSQPRPRTRGGSGEAHDLPRATSPHPQRSVSPRPAAYDDRRQGYRSLSPNPHPRAGRGQSQSLSPQKRDSDHGYFGKYNPQAENVRRGGSADVPANNQLQLSRAPDQSYDLQHYAPAPQGNNARPVSYYGRTSSRDNHSAQRQVVPASTDTRVRSRSINSGQQFTADGRLILHHSRAVYAYSAAIPEELSFAKGDILVILRHQDDGWWEAEVVGKNGRPGLVPSNYLKDC